MCKCMPVASVPQLVSAVAKHRHTTSKGKRKLAKGCISLYECLCMCVYKKYAEQAISKKKKPKRKKQTKREATHSCV